MLDQNVTKAELEKIAAATCLSASDEVKYSIEEYLSIYNMKNYQDENLIDMRKGISSKMRHDLLLTNFDFIDCFLYIYKERKIKSKTTNNKNI